MKKAIISGVTGQDGYLLSKHLKEKNYKILGLSRYKNKNKSIIKTDYSEKSLKKIINTFKPDEIYNLTGFTKPSLSWKFPKDNFFANLNITLNFLEILKIKKKIKFFNASSSEIFSDDDKLINEDTKIFPKNPYGISKTASYFLVNAYREKYGLFLINGILFNHESYKKDESYLLKYLLSSCKKLKEKKIKKITIKDSRPIRDFGCAKDFVKYFFELMQIKNSGNFIVATGKSYSVKKIVNIYRKKFNLSSNKFVFENKINFKTLHRARRANNKKLVNTLKLKNIKTLPEVINIISEDVRRYDE